MTHRPLLLAGAASLATGLVIGLIGGSMLAPPPGPAVPAAPAVVPAMVQTPPVSATPSSPPSANPPATETSNRTVVEEETLAAVAPPPHVAPAPPPGKPPPKGKAAWEMFAVAAPAADGRPRIAVIIDDMGLDRRRSEKILALPGPLTISFMSYAEDLARQTGDARAHGHELMMHLPMEPLGEGIDAGPGTLSESLPAEELKKRLVADLDRFKGYVGINNHMGSKFTAFAPGMQLVMEELHRRGLLFIDSLTTDHSVGLAVSRHAGVPAAARNVFLDNEADLGAVNGQLAKLEELARRKGDAIAIGHPRDATIAALAAWLPTLPAKGLVLVPVTSVVRSRALVTGEAGVAVEVTAQRPQRAK